MNPRPVIIDCDPGTDDAIALLLALASPELDVQAITVVGGNVGLGKTLANALAVVALTGKKVPVYAGAARGLLGPFTSEVRVHGENGLAGVILPPGPPPAPGLAADALRARIRAAATPLTLLGIGPATNLALALMAEPGLAENIAEIVLMSGAWGEGNVTPAAEFNAWSDPEALAVLLACGAPVAMATLDLTAQALVTPARLAALGACGQGRCLSAACDILAASPAHPFLPGAPLHDPCAIAYLIRPAFFTTRLCPIAVDLAPGPARGRTHIDRRGRHAIGPSALILETLDAEGFFTLLGERLTRLP